MKKYKLEQYTDVLIALMQQESRGKGGDPMQSSEAAGLAPNEIEDPKESIIQGVKHFNRVFTYGRKKRLIFQRLFNRIIWELDILPILPNMVGNILKN